MQSVSLPFQITDVYGGFGEVSGLVSLEKTGVRLEFQTKDSLFGVVKSAVKEILITFDQLERAQFKKGFFGFGAKLIFGVRSMKLLEAIPHTQQLELCLKVKRGYVEAASQLIWDLENAMTHQKYLAAIDEPGEI